MTTFMFGNEYGLTIVQAVEKFFYTEEVIVCARHLRRELQPVTSYDQEKGYGLNPCPFCPGGPLAGRFHQARSIRAWESLLDSLRAPAPRTEKE